VNNKVSSLNKWRSSQRWCNLVNIFDSLTLKHFKNNPWVTKYHAISFKKLIKKRQKWNEWNILDLSVCAWHLFSSSFKHLSVFGLNVLIMNEARFLRNLFRAFFSTFWTYSSKPCCIYDNAGMVMKRCWTWSKSLAHTFLAILYSLFDICGLPFNHFLCFFINIRHMMKFSGVVKPSNFVITWIMPELSEFSVWAWLFLFETLLMIWYLF